MMEQCQVDATKVLALARVCGFRLVPHALEDRIVWGWQQDGDDRCPRFLTTRQAVEYMDDRLRRTRVIAA
jgi:hypothetical protein